ncbi:putative sodium-dependent multivitamin transporter isoform X2 [Solenopsis invicta]|uniref:putative sodium-dependent multivitamin transporter isoform X2 n=1 Tax=Solenopsis invicta TaxID=13686 RepID=UPI00193E180E|nr:putative sodium-dependent multivitamin transporter isoform X2 [Solenopsis invicta]
MDVSTNNVFYDGEVDSLQWQDYLVIGTTMSIFVIIGLYYRFTGGRQRSIEEYFTADGSIGFLPLSVAMMASYVSGLVMLGKSGESYIRGLFIVLMYLTDMYVVPIIVLCYLPVFFKLKAISIYEYLQQRFGLYIRLLVSVIYFFETTLMAGVMLYLPSIALEDTTGLPSTTSIFLLAMICTFYSTFGGIKATLMNGVLQGLFMLITLLVIIIVASQNVDGGIGGLWSIAEEGNRTQFSEVSLDPTVHYTWWSLLLGGGSVCLTSLAVNQMHFQRIKTAKNAQGAMNALFFCGPFISLAGILTCFAGISIYAIYKDCDPVASKQISSYDKILLYFAARNLPPGIVGFIISGVFCAVLSTVSAMINSLAAVALEDHVKPLYRKFGKDISDGKAALIAKILTVVNGFMCMNLAFFAEVVGEIVAFALSIHLAVGGPILGTFTLGIISERANEKGTIIGTITSLIICLVAAFGKPKPPIPKLPVSIENCANSTKIFLIEEMNFNSTIQDPSEYSYLYRISYLWYTPIGLVITLIVGYVASIIIQRIQGGDNIEHDPDLFVPCLAIKMKQRRQDPRYTTGSQLFILEDLKSFYDL